MEKTILSIFLSFLFLSLVFSPVVNAKSNRIQNVIDAIKEVKGLDDFTKFKLKGVLLYMSWLFLFLKPRARFPGVALVSFLTTRWQLEGHQKGYLATNDTEPLDGEELHLYGALYLAILTFLNGIFKNKALAMTALSFNIWEELGYRMGYFSDQL